jgi:amidohydrolase
MADARDIDAVKDRIVAEVDKRADVLVDASHQLHDRPELGYEEHFAHDLLTSILEADGLPVVRGARELETAFEARAGSEGPTIAVLCEYDALPGIGHACGHNIIGTAGLGAGLAAAALADELGGRVAILGTPAEEGGGGKVFMAERGALDDVDAAMMVHPAGADLSAMNAIAIQQVWVEYHGQAAHAAAFPHRGRNALDAAVLGYVNVAALRQHIRPNERVHGIFTSAGDKPNIVPNFAAAQWYVRSPTMRTLEPLKERVLTCLTAGTAAAGCTMDHTWKDPAYADMVDNAPMVELYRANAGRVGRTLLDPGAAPAVVGSTDMGNVSYLVPSIHPMIKVAPANVSIHSPEFTKYAASEDGDLAVLDGAKALAMTVVDLWLRPDVLQAAKDDFAAAIAARA